MFKFCLENIKKFKGTYLIFFGTSCIVAIIDFIIPILSGEIINVLTIQRSKNLLFNYCALFLGLGMVQMLIKYLNQKTHLSTQANVMFAINAKVIRHLQNVPIKYTQKMNTSYLNERIYSDSNGLSEYGINVSTNFVINIFTLVIGFLFLFNINVYIGLILLILSIFYILLYMFSRKHISSLSLAAKEGQSKFFASLEEQLKNIKFIQMHSIAEELVTKLTNEFNKFYKILLKTQLFYYIYTYLDTATTMIAQVVVFILGGLMVLNGGITIGLFITIIKIFQIIINSIGFFCNAGKEYQVNKVSYQRLKDLLDIEELSDGEIKPINIHSLTITNLGFSYDNKKILNDVSFTFSRGKIYGIIGPNGSGKSTLIDIITGLRKGEYLGEIIINTENTDKLSMKWLRKHKLSIIEQEPLLLSSTVKDNIFLYNNVNMEKFNTIAEELKVLTFFDNLPYGVLSDIDQRASNVSGGEKQKIALVRQLLYTEADILICDEPTSALDKATVDNLLMYLQKIKKDKIIIIITHDQKVINCCDELLDIS